MALWNSPGFLDAATRRASQEASEPPLLDQMTTKRGRSIKQIVPRRLSRGSTSSESSEVEVFDVEAILTERRRNGEAEFLVKWLGYGEESNTWEPERNLEACPMFHRHAIAKNPSWQPMGQAARTAFHNTSPDDALSEVDVAEAEADDGALQLVASTDDDESDGDTGGEDAEPEVTGLEPTNTNAAAGAAKRRRSRIDGSCGRNKLARLAQPSAATAALAKATPIAVSPIKPRLGVKASGGRTSKLYAQLLAGKFGIDGANSNPSPTRSPKKAPQSPSEARSPGLKQKLLAAKSAAGPMGSPKLASRTQGTLRGFIQLEVPETPAGLPVGSASPSKSPARHRRQLIPTPTPAPNEAKARQAGLRLAAALAEDEAGDEDGRPIAANTVVNTVAVEMARGLIDPLDDEHPDLAVLVAKKAGVTRAAKAQQTTALGAADSSSDWLTMA